MKSSAPTAEEPKNRPALAVVKTRRKNRALVTEYLAKGASERFFELARYGYARPS